MKYRSILLHCTPTAVLMHTLSYTYVPYPFGDHGILVECGHGIMKQQPMYVSSASTDCACLLLLYLLLLYLLLLYLVPTTAVPTAVPTSAVPTTAVPTTAVPTTAVPTTAVSTTAVPTTAVHVLYALCCKIHPWRICLTQRESQGSTGAAQRPRGRRCRSGRRGSCERTCVVRWGCGEVSPRHRRGVDL